MTSVSEDGVALTAAPHPVAPWYKRLWWRLRYGGKPRLNEQSLEEMLIEIKKISKGKRIKLKPTQMFVPFATVQQVAELRGITIEEAQQYLRDVAERLMKGAKDE